VLYKWVKPILYGLASRDITQNIGWTQTITMLGPLFWEWLLVVRTSVDIVSYI